MANKDQFVRPSVLKGWRQAAGSVAVIEDGGIGIFIIEWQAGDKRYSLAHGGVVMPYQVYADGVEDATRALRAYKLLVTFLRYKRIAKRDLPQAIADCMAAVDQKRPTRDRDYTPQAAPFVLRLRDAMGVNAYRRIRDMPANAMREQLARLRQR